MALQQKLRSRVQPVAGLTWEPHGTQLPFESETVFPAWTLTQSL